MPLENSNTIAGLDDSWPLGSDPTNRGDDHLRLIKSVLKSQFPGTNGDGLNIPIVATEQELNWLEGLTDNVQTQFDDLTTRVDELSAILSAEPGTRLTALQANAPLGWTQLTGTDDHDYLMRTVSVNGGGGWDTYESDSPILNDKVPSHTHPFSATSSHVGDHVHALNRGWGEWGQCNNFGQIQNAAFSCGNSYEAISGAGGHSHSINGDTSTNSGSESWQPRYLDFIVIEKD